MGDGVKAFSTTRHGGYSHGRYGEFNINAYCGDEEENIRRNRQALCTRLGIGNDRLLMPHQVHETRAAIVDEELLALTAEQRRETLEGCDAMMTNLRGVCIGVSTADCIPILLYDVAHRAVAAVHAGWRGTVARITEKTVAAMTATYGTNPLQVRAQIGPGISCESFEVGDEVYEAFAREGFDMKPISRREEKWHIDLPECNRRQLLASGLKEENISMAAICTYRQAADFFSARRLGIRSGRIFTAIMLQ